MHLLLQLLFALIVAVKINATVSESNSSIANPVSSNTNLIEEDQYDALEMGLEPIDAETETDEPIITEEPNPIVVLDSIILEDEGIKFEPKKISHNLRMPVLGFGTAALGSRGVESICHALTSGYRLFDSAQAKEWYQEADMGKALKDCWKSKSLDELLIVTKVHPRSFPNDTMLKDLKASQQYIYSSNRTLDVVLLHAPYCWWADCTEVDKSHSWIDAWKSLEKFQEMGIIHAIGVSNFNAPQLEELIEIANKRISVLQNWMDPFHQDREVRALCKDNNIAYMAYSSLGTQWHWKGEDNPVFASSVLQSIAKKHSKSIALVVQSWVIQEGAIVIPRTTDFEHITENAVLLGMGGNQRAKVFLDDQDMALIRSLDGTNYSNGDY